MSSRFPRFRGKKRGIFEGLLRGEDPEDIAGAVDTTVRYVDNVASEVRRKYRINLLRNTHLPHETLPEAPDGPEAEHILERREQTAPITNPASSASSEPRPPNLQPQTTPPADPELQALEERVSTGQQRLAQQQHKQQLLVTDAHLTNLSEETDLRIAIADICPTNEILLTNKVIHHEAMRRILNTCEPYRTMFELVVKANSWGPQELQAIFNQYFYSHSLSYGEGWLHVTETFLRDYVLRFLNFIQHMGPFCIIDGVLWSTRW